jgi:acetone carboxylase gamma subunit
MGPEEGTDLWVEEQRQAGNLLFYSDTSTKGDGIFHVQLVEPDPDLTAVTHLVCGQCCSSHDLEAAINSIAEHVSVADLEPAVTCPDCWERLGQQQPEGDR